VVGYTPRRYTREWSPISVVNKLIHSLKMQLHVLFSLKGSLYVITYGNGIIVTVIPEITGWLMIRFNIVFHPYKTYYFIYWTQQYNSDIDDTNAKEIMAGITT